MLKTLMISAALSGLLDSGALAQSNPPAGSLDAKSHAAETKSPKFIQAQGTDKWAFSRFKGTDVLGPDNAKVGSVSDLLFDKNGKIDGFIVGVGGFLGIGEKNVAIDMSAGSHPCESEGVLDEGRAQGRSGLPILPGTRTHCGAAGSFADHGDGTAASSTRP